MEKKYFSRYQKPRAELPTLAEVQTASYRWFMDEGIGELFKEIAHIREEVGAAALKLEFVSHSFDESKCSEQLARENNLSYEAALRVRARLTNARTKEIKEQEIYLGDFPLMTPRGTFIINGVERVVVSQLVRSPGAYFISHLNRGLRCFGAKIIPNRGAWLEFESDTDGALHVKIDRKRKIAATALLRVFDLKTNEAITAAFVPPREEKQASSPAGLLRTLEKDTSKNQDEAFIEVYKRIRPGDLATADNARSLIRAMFSHERYDLAEVGRYKFNQRLNLGEDHTDRRTLDAGDLVAVMREIMRLNAVGDVPDDDIDHLGNRRVRAVGELLQNKLHVGIARMSRIIRDRMSTLDPEPITPAQRINARPFIAAVREFFMSSQLSQFMDQHNPLAELEHKRRLSAMGPGGLQRERAGFEVRDVHTSHYGRICPIETPEGPNIGLVGHLAGHARVNRLGLIETPYMKVENGRLTGIIEELDAASEANFRIAHAGVPIAPDGRIATDRVEARIYGSPGVAAPGEVDYIDVSAQQAISIATSLIPFLEHDDTNRAMMGSNMQRQAVPCVIAQAPLVSTGVETRAARDSGRIFIAEEDGVVEYADGQKMVVKGKSGKRWTYELAVFQRTNHYTVIRQRPIVATGARVKRGDILTSSSAIDDGDLALGQNVLVAFLSWSGSNYEDAIIISERMLKGDRYTSVHIENFSVDVRDTKLGPEITTHDIPNVGEEKLKNLDEDGIIVRGAEVRSGDILVGKISPKGESDLTPEEKLLRAIFGEKARDVKDSSLRLSHGKRGRVVGIKVFSREQGDKLEPGVIKRIQVDIAQLRKVSVGDKLAGRHGNKGVIAKILPEEDMPFLEDGTPVDMILNPMGVASRMNIGQILETHLGWAAHKLGYRAITPALSGVMEGEIKEELRRAGLPEDGKVLLRDGRNGRPFGQKVTVGYMYMLKLIHLVEDKIHMRSIGPYSLITQQPLGGKAQFGGQRFGEMEVWALEGYGAAHTLQEMLTIKSDDVLGRSATYEAIINGERIKKPNVPASFNVLMNELKGLGLDVQIAQKQGATVGEDEYEGGAEAGAREEGARAGGTRERVGTA